MVRMTFFISAPLLLGLVILFGFFYPVAYWALLFVIPYILLGLYDLRSTKNVLRVYPVFGHFRYMFEFVRPEIQQYFVATNLSGRPYNREIRSLIYQRAKGAVDTLPFGTQRDISDNNYELAYHSLKPCIPSKNNARVKIGNYWASRLNISAMSFGALSPTAVMAMNLGASQGNFAQNTGEGGISPYHLQFGGDLIWQVGTGYFGARTIEGIFCPTRFCENAQRESVKMIEIKLSQGAKPAHGGILPAAKVDNTIATLRGITPGVDCISPPAHSAFENPIGLCEFIAQCRELSGGKPVGIKLAIGHVREFMAIVKGMLKTGLFPDFITIDGAEGGTGAAPLEFSNRLGMPINDALNTVHNILVGAGIRNDIRLIASGKVATGFDCIVKAALGADAFNSARAMMFAVGCIQALRCNMNTCPTGVTSQNPTRYQAVVPEHKAKHISNYHNATLESFLELLGAMGLTQVADLSASDVLRRLEHGRAIPYSQYYPQLAVGQLLDKGAAGVFAESWEKAQAEVF